MNISLNELSPLIEICVAMISGLTFLYFRLSSRIDKTDQKLDQKFDSLRAEMKEDRQEIERKFDKVDQKFERMESKLDRIMEMMFTQNQISRSTHFHKKNKKVV